MLTSFTKYLRRFRDDRRGSVAIEAVVMLPILFWALVATFTFFDAYRQVGQSIKANYTISDMLSRETAYINPDYMNTAQQLYNLMTRTTTATRLRITVVRYDGPSETFKRDWSKTRGSVSPLTSAQVADLESRLPSIPHNDRLIVVETWKDYKPPFRIGIEPQELYHFSFTRPRFAPILPWSDV